MNEWKWILEVPVALLGGAGIFIVACGLWFLYLFVESMIYGSGGYGLIVAVCSVSSTLIGVGLLFVTRNIFRKIERL